MSGLNEESVDGMLGQSKVQVAFNNCPQDLPLIVSGFPEFDQLIVILGPNCALRSKAHRDSLVVFRFTTGEVKQRFKRVGNNLVGERAAFDGQPDWTLEM